MTRRAFFFWKTRFAKRFPGVFLRNAETSDHRRALSGRENASHQKQPSHSRLSIAGNIQGLSDVIRFCVIPAGDVRISSFQHGGMLHTADQSERADCTHTKYLKEKEHEG